MNVILNVYVWWSINILMLIKTDVYINQHTIINEGHCYLDSLYCSWIANSCVVAKVRNRILTAVMWSSGDSIQYAVCYMAAWMFTALWALLFSRHNTVDNIQYAVCYMAAWMFTVLWAWLFSRHNTVDRIQYAVLHGSMNV